jgi:hypothetical protein
MEPKRTDIDLAAMIQSLKMEYAHDIITGYIDRKLMLQVVRDSHCL